MKNIIFLTYLNLWSMEKDKGAPSFFKTIEAYIEDGWNVTLINPDYNIGVTPKLEGMNIMTFNPVFYRLVFIEKISFFGRIIHSLHGNYMLYKLGKKALKNYNNEAVIYSYEVNGVKAGLKLKEKYQLPFVTRFQGTVLYPIKDNFLNRLKKYPHFQALETESDLIIMTDDGTHGDRVLEKLKNKTENVKFWRNGVDVNTRNFKNEIKINELRKKMRLSPDDKVLMTVSRLATWKKVNRAIEALSLVIKDRPNVKLVIVGDGVDKQNLIELTEKLQLTSNVVFVGAIPQTDVRDYLELADIFLSLYNLSNVGNPLLEAMSSGKPIITLNVGDTGSLITNEENGIILDLDNISRIPEYINKILDDSNFAKKLGDNATKYARTNFWSWHERMNTELEVVSELRKNIFWSK